MWASNGVSLDLGQVLREKRLVRLMNLSPLLEFCLGKSEVISGDSHSQGLSKSTILLCLPFWGHLLGDSCSMAVGQVILSETDGEWKEKKLSLKWQPAPEFLPEKPHGCRSLAGYSPKGCKESDTMSDWAQVHYSVGILQSAERLQPSQGFTPKLNSTYMKT